MNNAWIRWTLAVKNQPPRPAWGFEALKDALFWAAVLVAVAVLYGWKL